MVEQVIVYKTITEHSFEYGPDAQLGDLVVGISDKDNVPIGWTKLPTSLVDFRLNQFQKGTSFPSLVFLKGNDVPKRIALAAGQIWRPVINFRTRAPKIIVSINPEEIYYRWGGDHIWCEPESFYEWIIYAQASLVESNTDD